MTRTPINPSHLRAGFQIARYDSTDLWRVDVVGSKSDLRSSIINVKSGSRRVRTAQELQTDWFLVTVPVSLLIHGVPVTVDVPADKGLDIENILCGLVASFDALNTPHRPDEESVISDIELRDERDGFAIECLWQVVDAARKLVGPQSFMPELLKKDWSDQLVEGVLVAFRDLPRGCPIERHRAYRVRIIDSGAGTMEIIKANEDTFGVIVDRGLVLKYGYLCNEDGSPKAPSGPEGEQHAD